MIKVSLETIMRLKESNAFLFILLQDSTTNNFHLLIILYFKTSSNSLLFPSFCVRELKEAVDIPPQTVRKWRKKILFTVSINLYNLI